MDGIITILPFISDVFEKVVLRQLRKHLSDNSFFEMHQSASRSLERLKVTFGLRALLLCGLHPMSTIAASLLLLMAAPSPLVYGIPQGSILGPV